MIWQGRKVTIKSSTFDHILGTEKVNLQWVFQRPKESFFQAEKGLQVRLTPNIAIAYDNSWKQADLLPSKGPVLKAQSTEMIRKKSLVPFIPDIGAWASIKFSYSIRAYPWTKNLPFQYLQVETSQYIIYKTCEIIYQGVKHIQQILQSPPFSNVFQGFILDTSHIASPIRIKISNSQVANPSATNARIPHLVTIMTNIHKY